MNIENKFGKVFFKSVMDTALHSYPRTFLIGSVPRKFYSSHKWYLPHEFYQNPQSSPSPKKQIKWNTLHFTILALLKIFGISFHNRLFMFLTESCECVMSMTCIINEW